MGLTCRPKVACRPSGGWVVALPLRKQAPAIEGGKTHLTRLGERHDEKCADQRPDCARQDLACPFAACSALEKDGAGSDRSAVFGKWPPTLLRADVNVNPECENRV